MIEPLRLSFDVGCSVQHAFATWTSGIGSGWPADHTVTADNDLSVVLEPRVGGRIYERTGAGTEHDWGEVTIWEPPPRLGYSWHLRGDRGDATDVEIRFMERSPGATRIEIEHRGWEQLGAAGQDWRDRDHRGWQTLLPHYLAAIATTTITLRYHLSAIDDLHAWLREQGDWVDLGVADEREPARDGTVEAWGRALAGESGRRLIRAAEGYRGRFGMYLPPLLEALELAELTHDARNNRMRAR
ncbi:MAG: DUF6855 family protein [Solirubrobacteraceae bacterium]